MGETRHELCEETLQDLEDSGPHARKDDMLRNFVTASPGGLKGGVPRIRCASNAA
eukprot:CAMPEP_0180643976 /NCGR_PEP_ID=MMETSP1037_2-20121125/48147_1 /TAXON_ID=632150 /ORGANISM="Azadinium spinosum, Strain 3D9" /LENGTH=54 /DNA_ID=CAMNT_0022667611 /DNA_START=12 /DNA_END=174 /DNA_ORIENTATION=+